MNAADYCAACGQVADEHGVSALYITVTGRAIPHRLCGDCAARAEASRAGHATVAELVELRLLPAGGRA